MNEFDALTFVRSRLQPEVDPVITDQELLDLLPLGQAEDENGVAPGGDGYVPTWSTVGCYRVVAAGWEMKYGRAVGRYSFTTDGQTFNRQQTLDQIKHMRDMYKAKVQHSSRVGVAL